MSEKQEHHN